jgi:hypothetical protein
MPLQKLQFRPGVNREGTTLANEGGWFECDKVRFRSGYPEKIGGWAALSYTAFLGTARSLWNWITLTQYNLLGIGTNVKFYVEDTGGDYYDITPIKTTTTGTATFFAFNGSSTITVIDAGVSNLQAGDFVTFSGAVSLGGNITAAVLNQEYQIASVVSSSTYTITATATANASDVGNGGASVVAAYQISTGQDIATVGTGWGTGPWSPYLTTLLGANPIATTSGSNVVTVTQTAHGYNTNAGSFVVGQSYKIVTVGTTNFRAIGATSNTVGNIFTATGAGSGTGVASLPYVAITGATDVGGIPAVLINRTVEITVTNPNTFTFRTNGGVAPTINATSTVPTGGGASVTVAYPNPAVVASAGRGWGVGFASGIPLQLRLWTQSNYGQELLFSPRGGALYVWDPGSGTTPAYGTRGTLVSGTDVPAFINQIMVSDTSRITIAFGCSDYGAYPQPQDPMLIRWSNAEDYTATGWPIDPANSQAGFNRLSRGSYIVGALQTRQEILVWTDQALYSMQYLGPPYVYGFTLLADNISIISPNAMSTANGVTYWMGTDKFYVYSGRLETLPSSLRQYVFEDINIDQAFQCFSGTNEGYSEIWWFYCSAASDVIDRYVIFNYLDRVWYYGTMGRSAWLDSALRPFPQAATLNNLIVYHEAAVDDGSTNPPSPITSYVQSSDFDIGDGHNYGFVWQMIPDITFDGSTTPAPNYPNVTFTIRPRQNPGAPYGTSNTPVVASTQSYAAQQVYNVQEFTEIVYTRLRGRQMAFRIDSDSLGTQWQLGTPRINVRPDGRR